MVPFPHYLKAIAGLYEQPSSFTIIDLGHLIDLSSTTALNLGNMKTFKCIFKKLKNRKKSPMESQLELKFPLFFKQCLFQASPSSFITENLLGQQARQACRVPMAIKASLSWFSGIFAIIDIPYIIKM